jgi:hypothetical protein
LLVFFFEAIFRLTMISYWRSYRCEHPRSNYRRNYHRDHCELR